MGGKAAQLGALLRHGINVPDGFVIPTEVSVHWEKNLEWLILQHFDKLRSPYVAVRSSATAEDSADTTWAGQFDTYLFVNRNDLISKIKSCIKSTRSARSMAYRDATNMSAVRPKIAVIIQAMVPAEVSGVCFSVHPVTLLKDRLVIEAAYGLGEPVVSGDITPDNYIITRKTHRIISKTVAKQFKYLTFKEKMGKTSWEKTTHPSDQKLSDSQIKKLATEVESIEAYFGYPVDVEWALDNGKYYILQSRPITTL